MERGRFYQQFEREGGKAGAGNDQSGSVANPFATFVESLAPTGERAQTQERGLQRIHPFDPYALMDSFNYNFECKRWSALGFQPTEEQNLMVYRVRLVYGILAHPFCLVESSPGVQSTAYQDTIETHIALDRVRNGNNRIVLNDAEREILAKITKAAGILCDVERSEYFFDEIPQKTLHNEDLYRTPKIVDSDT